ncbi:sensor histidine kinase [Actinomadura sp. HBU206391]|uniref:sensor histidine kinase n=1 Tax=Actinomadura sp. HBU206391 TaxID=2731692 RepID=UPI00164FEA04|nr:histidine kinase [Actinomadura sp. HBU206391]MBC6462303.1 sensor histidine kinase [Actinomadura sp. HBU206391]
MSGERRAPVVDLGRITGDGPTPAALCFWLCITFWPVRDLLGYRDARLLTAVCVLLVVVALYVATVLSAFSARVSMRVPVALLTVLAVAVSAAALGFGGRWYPLFPMLGIACAAVLGHHVTRRSETLMVAGVGAVTGLAVLVTWLGGEDGGAILGFGYGTATASMVTAMILRLSAVITVLRETREELARTAVAEERLRFSRDLHDLLGHTLSLMVVKAQAVRRIMERDPAVAAEQAADIETVGRRALAEVRQAVTGYRGRGLSAELNAARTALGDAAIEAVVRQEGPPPPPHADALLGWAVREGVTNVIRHSGARRCEIDVRHDGDVTSVEIRDDGTAEPPGAVGHGLSGLTERMATAGGTLTAGRRADGGFRLAVTLPAGAPA